MVQLGEIANYWREGYREDFASTNPINPLLSALDKLPSGRCLEIGCGDGYWTNELLVPKFKEVIAVDVIDKPKYFKGEYHKQTGCNLKQFSDKSFDVVYSFGVFCHLPLDSQKAYLKEIRRVLKGKALIMFANWERNGSLRHREDHDFVDGWYNNTLERTKEMVKDCGFEFIDFDPNYRDTIGILW
jgi:SAM-dependent methyltransferase